VTPLGAEEINTDTRADALFVNFLSLSHETHSAEQVLTLPKYHDLLRMLTIYKRHDLTLTF
jgi:hypothetical protein